MELALWTSLGVVKKKKKKKDQVERTLSYFPALNLITTTVIVIIRITFYLSNVFCSEKLNPPKDWTVSILIVSQWVGWGVVRAGRRLGFIAGE